MTKVEEIREKLGALGLGIEFDTFIPNWEGDVEFGEVCCDFTIFTATEEPIDVYYSGYSGFHSFEDLYEFFDDNYDTILKEVLDNVKKGGLKDPSQEDWS